MSKIATLIPNKSPIPKIKAAANSIELDNSKLRYSKCSGKIPAVSDNK